MPCSDLFQVVPLGTYRVVADPSSSRQFMTNRERWNRATRHNRSGLVVDNGRLLGLVTPIAADAARGLPRIVCTPLADRQAAEKARSVDKHRGLGR